MTPDKEHPPRIPHPHNITNPVTISSMGNTCDYQVDSTLSDTIRPPDGFHSTRPMPLAVQLCDQHSWPCILELAQGQALAAFSCALSPRASVYLGIELRFPYLHQTLTSYIASRKACDASYLCSCVLVGCMLQRAKVSTVNISLYHTPSTHSTWT